MTSAGNVLERIAYVGDFAQLTEYGTLQAFADKTQSQTWHYLHRDHLESIEAIIDENGLLALTEGVSQYFSYDAFGQPRIPLGDVTNRGFTDHEHLSESGLIHMNGRVYDPLISRFLSADPIVQAPEFSQSYNHYSYVWNNPLSLVDPSGYAGTDFIAGAGIILVPVIVAMWSEGDFTLKLASDDSPGDNIFTFPIHEADGGAYVHEIPEVPTFTALITPIVGGVIKVYINVIADPEEFSGRDQGGVQVPDDEFLSLVLVTNSGGKTFQTYTKTNPKTGQVYCGVLAVVEHPSKILQGEMRITK